LSPATVRSPSETIKLLSITDKKTNKIFALSPFLITGTYRISDIARKLKPGCKIPNSPGYWKVYHKIKHLQEFGLITLERRSNVNWKKTDEARLLELETSIQTIFRLAIEGQEQLPPPFVSTGTPPTDTDITISTVKSIERSLYVVPTGQLFYLFSQVQNSNYAAKSAKQPSEKWKDQLYRIPSKCAKERVQAIKQLMSIQDRKLFQRDLSCPKCKKRGTYQPGQKIANCSCGTSWKPPLNSFLKSEIKNIQSDFTDWHDNILNKELLFDRGPGTDLVRMLCRTRFTDKGRKVHNIKQFDHGWNRANILYKRGVFVTLTTDISLHKSLWHANRHLSRAFNRYISLLLSRKKRIIEKSYDTDEEELTGEKIKRLKYIAAYEFQENGLIHLHVVFFGIRYLASIDKISLDWQRCGQGRIVHAYGIYRNNDTWSWAREKPKDAEGKSPTDYLRKYLEKALYVNENFGLYWAMNKRFCTMSRIFQTKECEGCRTVLSGFLRICPACGAQLIKYSKGYRYLGTCERNSIPSAQMMSVHSWPVRETGPGIPA
jgi:hypothetical protein